MKIGDTFACSDHAEFKIIQEGKSGGQGSTWKVQDLNSNDFFLKIINEQDRSLKYKKQANIRYLYDRKNIYMSTLTNKRYNIALPLHIYEIDGEFGYIMQACPGYEINNYMCEGTFEKMTVWEKLGIIMKLAEAMAWIHDNGLCYQDISHKNFMYSEKSNKQVSLIDCDNLAPETDVHNGDRAFVKGTAFYAAPEVVFEVDEVSHYSDSYAMAVLFYKILTDSIKDSPYHGQILYSKRPRPMSMYDAATYVKEEPDYGKEWLTFVFDEKNNSNAINVNQFPKDREWRLRQEKIIENWRKIPLSVKELFYHSFCDPLKPECYKKRPSAPKWQNTIKRILQSDNDTFHNVKSSVSELIITFPNGKKTTIKDSFILDGMTVGVSKINWGRIEKDNNKFKFVSECTYAIQCSECDALLRKSDGIEICDGMEIYIVTKPSQKIRFNL